MTEIRRDLVFDVGMSEGNDTAFYLDKGFSVLGIEADPVIVPQLHQRFQSNIEAGKLRIIAQAAARASGETIEIWHATGDQGTSGFRGNEGAGSSCHTVTTICWEEMVSIANGIPYYLKVDIEGAERSFLEGMLKEKTFPAYASAECQNPDPICLFYDLGYREFKLINQVKHAEFRVPNPPLEGRLATPPDYHWSGLFGQETPGQQWFSFETILDLYRKLHELWETETIIVGWHDVHVRRQV